jgi:hypothetical protein
LARLVIYEEIDTDDTVFETFELSSSRILIGSDHDNHLVLDMPDVDTTHASIELRDNHWFLQDLGGPGGTAVNGEEIEGPYMLRNNDIIELSFIKMRFENNERGVTQDFPRDVPEEEQKLPQERPCKHSAYSYQHSAFLSSRILRPTKSAKNVDLAQASKLTADS